MLNVNTCAKVKVFNFLQENLVWHLSKGDKVIHNYVENYFEICSLIILVVWNLLGKFKVSWKRFTPEYVSEIIWTVW